jgi:hypothetical protein
LVVITVPFVDALAELPAAAELAGAEDEAAGDEAGDAAALPHAVASSAEASGTPTLTGSGIFVRSERIIVIVSFRAVLPAAPGLRAAAALRSCLMT